MAFGLEDKFNEPPTDDPTRLIPQNLPKSSNPVLDNLKKKKKQSIRPPGPLAQQIGRAKRARQSGQRWG